MIRDDQEVDPERSGAEWWTQVIDTRDDIGIHWDRDYGIEEDTGKHVYPHLATVTYLNTKGGATIIFDSVGSSFAEESLEGSPVKWLVSSNPKVGKHTCFDGRLLHAAPSDFEALAGGSESSDESDDEDGDDDEDDDDDDGVERITFLVNVWINHEPIQLRRFGPTADEMNALALAPQTEPASLIHSRKIGEIDRVIIASQDEGKILHMPVTSGDSDYIIPVYQPLLGIQHTHSSTTSIDFEKCRAKVAISPKDEDDDDQSNEGEEDENGDVDDEAYEEDSPSKDAGKKRKRGGSSTLGLLFMMYISFVFCILTPSHAYTSQSSRLSYDRSLSQLGQVIEARALNAEPKYMSEAMQKRIDQGNLNAADLRRMFVPTKREVEDLKHSKIAGQAGIILDLEGVLVDLTAVFMLTFTLLANEFRQESPTWAAAKDVIGLTPSDSFLALGWTIRESEMKLAQRRFRDNFKIVLESMPVGMFEGADASIDAYIADGNTMVISTMLPRDLAVRAISKAGLSATLEGRVDGTCLVFHDAAKDRLAGNQLIRCVAQLQVPLEFTICIASNAKTILAAKRVGMTVTGIRNNVRDLYALRTADTVVDSLKSFPPRAMYDIISKNYINNIGPSPEPAAASDSVRIKSRTLPAPAMEDEVPRDTFADEFGADLL